MFLWRFDPELERLLLRLGCPQVNSVGVGLRDVLYIFSLTYIYTNTTFSARIFSVVLSPFNLSLPETFSQKDCGEFERCDVRMN